MWMFFSWDWGIRLRTGIFTRRFRGVHFYVLDFSGSGDKKDEVPDSLCVIWSAGFLQGRFAALPGGRDNREQSSSSLFM